MTDDAATQQAILPATNPRAKKIPLSDFDRTDILCILTPTTPAAYRAVELVAATAGHHILQHPKKHSNLNKTTPADQMEVDSNVKAKPKTKTSLDIALRMSSMIINPAFGFVFGRDNTKSDLLISDGEEINGKQVSGRHFRIYVNPSGSLMCQDTSTNGTYVDSQLLRPQRQPVDHGDKMTLHHGSVIEIQAGPHMESLRFFVQVPDRSGVSMQYGSRLDQYIDFMDQMKRRRQAEQNRREIGLPPDMAPVSEILFSSLCSLADEISRNHYPNSVAAFVVTNSRPVPIEPSLLVQNLTITACCGTVAMPIMSPTSLEKVHLQRCISLPGGRMASCSQLKR